MNTCATIRFLTVRPDDAALRPPAGQDGGKGAGGCEENVCRRLHAAVGREPCDRVAVCRLVWKCEVNV